VRRAASRVAAPGRAPRGPERTPARSGTHRRIFDAVRRIPRGRVSSYGEVARDAGLAGQARLVGWALHASPADVLPWHRVVNARGALSLARLDPSGALTQRMRLEREGVTFDPAGRVRMDRHRWSARGRAGGAATPRRSRHQLGGVKTNGA